MAEAWVAKTGCFPSLVFSPSLLRSLDPPDHRVLLERLLKVHPCDVRQSHQPRQHIRELLLQVRPLLRRDRPLLAAGIGRRERRSVVVQGGGQFADLLHEQKKRPRCAPRRIRRVVTIADELLEGSDCEGGWRRVWHGRSVSCIVIKLVFQSLLVGLVCLWLGASGGGCITAFDRSRVTLEAMHEQGNYDAAARMLDDPAVRDEYGERNKLLYWLDRGAVALAQKDNAKAIDLLEKAESTMEVDREPTGGEQLSRWLLNDTVVSYYGQPYEEIYVNVLKMLAQLQAGQIDGGATVEARRAAGKADVLRDRYIKRKEGVVGGGNGQFQSALAGTMRSVDANEQGEFIESTLGDYLSAIAFMKSGDADFQSVAGRRLASAIALQRGLQGGGEVDEAKFANIGAMRPEDGNVLIVGLSGRGPTMTANKIGPIPVYEWPVYFELPELRGGSEEVGSARVIAEPAWTPTPNVPASPPPATLQSLDKIEDFRIVAAENHRRQLPLIVARTVLRSQLKAAAAFAATEAVKHSQRRGNDRNLAQIGMIIAGLVFVGGTEKADLRCWAFLPGRADVTFLKLPPGKHRVRIEYLSRNGGVLYSSPPREITVPEDPRGLVTVVEHYWR